jgi:hypothetical protein
MINEPVSKCTIVFKYLYWTPDRKGKRYYHDRFVSIDELREYFKRHPGAGVLVGYGKRQPGNIFAFEASLLVDWTDQTANVSKEFTNVHEFTRFLKENPVLAEIVGYNARV